MTHGAPAKKDAIPPPDGGWGWVVVFGSFMIHIVADGLTYSLGIFIVEFMHYFEEKSEATSWIASILVGVTLGSGPIASSFVNKYGCRAVTIAGSVISAFGLGISIFATNVETLYFTIGIVAGFGFGLIYLPAIVSVTCYFEKKRSFATGIAVCGSGVGTFIFAPLTEMLITEYGGWKPALLIITAITLNCIFFGALFRPIEAPKKAAAGEALELTEKEKLMVISEETIEGAAKGSHSFVRNSVHDMPVNGNGNGTSTPSKIYEENNKNMLTVASIGDSNSARMARSQPHLLQVPASPHTNDCRKFGSYGNLPKRNNEVGSQVVSRKSSNAEMGSSGVMYRKDILYSGSLLNIPEYRSDPKAFSGSVVRIPEESPELDDAPDRKKTVCGCIPCEKESYHAFKEMMDFSLLLDPVFVLFAISNFCTSLGFNVPYVYMKDKALDLNIDSESASFLIAIIGIANTVGRVILGYISDKPWLNRLWLYNLALTVCGLSTALSSYCLDYASLAVYAAIFGASCGAYVGLTSVVLVDLLGLDKLTNAFGLLLLFQGVSSFIGPPICGRLRDTFGSYDPGFYVAGSMIAISGLMLFFVPLLQRNAAKVHDSTKEIARIENGADRTSS